jgi:hypothetical protein
VGADQGGRGGNERVNLNVNREDLGGRNEFCPEVPLSDSSKPWGAISNDDEMTITARQAALDWT